MAFLPPGLMTPSDQQDPDPGFLGKIGGLLGIGSYDPTAAYYGKPDSEGFKNAMLTRELAGMAAAGGAAAQPVPYKGGPSWGSYLGAVAGGGATAGDSLIHARTEAMQQQLYGAQAAHYQNQIEMANAVKPLIMEEVRRQQGGYGQVQPGAGGQPTTGAQKVLAGGGPVGGETDKQNALLVAAKYHDEIAKAVAEHPNVPPEMIAAVISAESRGDPLSEKTGTSKAGVPYKVQGLGNIEAGTSARYNVTDPFNPQQNINVIGAVLGEGLKKFPNDPSSALAYYYSGSDQPKTWGDDTRAYPGKVMSRQPTSDEVAGVYKYYTQNQKGYPIPMAAPNQAAAANQNAPAPGGAQAGDDQMPTLPPNTTNYPGSSNTPSGAPFVPGGTPNPGATARPAGAAPGPQSGLLTPSSQQLATLAAGGPDQVVRPPGQPPGLMTPQTAAATGPMPGPQPIQTELPPGGIRGLLQRTAQGVGEGAPPLATAAPPPTPQAAPPPGPVGAAPAPAGNMPPIQLPQFQLPQMPGAPTEQDISRARALALGLPFAGIPVPSYLSKTAEYPQAIAQHAQDAYIDLQKDLIGKGFENPTLRANGVHFNSVTQTWTMNTLAQDDQGRQHQIISTMSPRSGGQWVTLSDRVTELSPQQKAEQEARGGEIGKQTFIGVPGNPLPQLPGGGQAVPGGHDPTQDRPSPYNEEGKVGTTIPANNKQTLLTAPQFADMTKANEGVQRALETNPVMLNLIQSRIGATIEAYKGINAGMFANDRAMLNRLLAAANVPAPQTLGNVQIIKEQLQKTWEGELNRMATLNQVAGEGKPFQAVDEAGKAGSTLEPEAAVQFLSHDMGTVRWLSALSKDWGVASSQQAADGRIWNNAPKFINMWTAKNAPALDRFIKEAHDDFAGGISSSLPTSGGSTGTAPPAGNRHSVFNPAIQGIEPYRGGP